MPDQKHVLVVDDQPDNRHILSLLLEHHGYHVQLAADGREAVARARRRPPDLVLMDLAMPRMDGYEATEALLEECSKSMEIIAVTAADTTRDQLEPLGFCGYLRKPVPLKKLVKTVEECIGESSGPVGWICGD